MNQLYLQMPYDIKGWYDIKIFDNEIHLCYPDIDNVKAPKRFCKNRTTIPYNPELIGDYEIDEVSEDLIILTKIK